MMTTATVQSLAADALEYFGTRTRDDGSSFVTTSDDRPEWLTDLIFEAHGEFLPDDYRYRWIQDCLESISDTDTGALEDAAHEFADALTDVYTGRLLQWLSSNLQRVGYVDAMIEEMGIDASEGIVRMISAGQYEEIRETYAAVLASLEKIAEEVSG